jgi:methionine-gamma-lyase
MTYLPDTHAVHAGRDDLGELGVHALPLDFSTTYPLPDLEQGRDDLARMAQGHPPQHSPVYARLHNPTVGRFENAMAKLESAEAAVAFSTGMAAITAALLAAQMRGDHVIALRPLYGGSDHLLNSGLFKLDVTWATTATLKDAIRPSTSLIMLETPANPTLQMTDIEEVVAIAGDIPVLVDSTFATPVLQNPLNHGASMVLHSATKFLGGHGDVMGGVIATSENLAQGLRQIRIATGALLHPMGAYMLHRGLQTLPARIRTAQSTCEQLAHFLESHTAVKRVFYPGLSDTGLIPNQMRGGGSMLAFEIEGGFAAAAKVMGTVKMVTPAVSLGSTDTLIQHPAALTHQVVDEEVRDATGISGSLMRISVGLEDPRDIQADLNHALNLSQRKPKTRPTKTALNALFPPVPESPSFEEVNPTASTA